MDDINYLKENPIYTTEEGNSYNLEIFLCSDYKVYNNKVNEND